MIALPNAANLIHLAKYFVDWRGGRDRTCKNSCLVGLGTASALVTVLVFLSFDQTRNVREKRTAMAIAPTIVIASATTSLPYLLPLAEPFRYRHSLARVPVTAAVVDGFVILLSAR